MKEENIDAVAGPGSVLVLISSYWITSGIVTLSTANSLSTDDKILLAPIFAAPWIITLLFKALLCKPKTGDRVFLNNLRRTVLSKTVLVGLILGTVGGYLSSGYTFREAKEKPLLIILKELRKIPQQQ